MSQTYDLPRADEPPDVQPHGAVTTEWLAALARRFASVLTDHLGEGLPDSPCWPPPPEPPEPWLNAPALAAVRCLLNEENAEEIEATDPNRWNDPDAALAALAKELSDGIFVRFWAFALLGIEPGPVLAQVFRNNDLKLKTGTINAETGKLEKAPDHPKVHLLPVLAAMGRGREGEG